MSLPYDRTLKDFLNIRRARGCYSLTGRDGGAQLLGLDEPCAQEHTLIHEVRLMNLQQFFVVLYKQ